MFTSVHVHFRKFDKVHQSSIRVFAAVCRTRLFKGRSEAIEAYPLFLCCSGTVPKRQRALAEMQRTRRHHCILPFRMQLPSARCLENMNPRFWCSLGKTFLLLVCRKLCLRRLPITRYFVNLTFYLASGLQLHDHTTVVGVCDKVLSCRENPVVNVKRTS